MDPRARSSTRGEDTPSGDTQSCANRRSTIALSHKVPPNRALEGATLALKNADTWLSDARALLQAGSAAHATALVILGAEEVGKAVVWSGVPFVPLNKIDLRGVSVAGPLAHKAKVAIAVQRAMAVRLKAEVAAQHPSDAPHVPDSLRDYLERPTPELVPEVIKALRAAGIDVLGLVLRVWAAISRVDEMLATKMASMYVDWSDERGFLVPEATSDEAVAALIEFFEAAAEDVHNDIQHIETSSDRRHRRIGARSGVAFQEQLADGLPTTTVFLLSKPFPGRDDVRLLYVERWFRDPELAQRAADEMNASEQSPEEIPSARWEVVEDNFPSLLVEPGA